MKREMEMEEIEAVLDRIWDLHDKISDAIHSIAEAHFLKSIKTFTRPSPEKKYPPVGEVSEGADAGRCGYVFVKAFRADEDAALAEARSLNSIRTSLENLEDHLEFFHTLQSQQEAERDVAIARLEQSRMVLAMRLAEHHGKKYSVIEEAQAFVCDVQEAGLFVPPSNQFEKPSNRPGEDLSSPKERVLHWFTHMLFSSLESAKNTLSLDRINTSAVLGNAALFSLTMLAFLQLHQVAFKGEAPPLPDQSYRSRNEKDGSMPDFISQSNALHSFDVFSARG